MNGQLSNKTIRNVLVDGLIEGLRKRPRDFMVDQFRLIDRETGQTWWIANGFWFFKFAGHDLSHTHYNLGGLNKLRGWRAYQVWLRDHGYSSSGGAGSLKEAAEHLYRANEAAP